MRLRVETSCVFCWGGGRSWNVVTRCEPGKGSSPLDPPRLTGSPQSQHFSSHTINILKKQAANLQVKQQSRHALTETHRDFHLTVEAVFRGEAKLFFVSWRETVTKQWRPPHSRTGPRVLTFVTSFSPTLTSVTWSSRPLDPIPLLRCTRVQGHPGEYSVTSPRTR